MGKTRLLEYLAGRASKCQVARAAGVQSEMELAYAGLHQLCAPMMDHAGLLPAPQRDALRVALGRASSEMAIYVLAPYSSPPATASPLASTCSSA